jgi:hypothetical protein
MDLTDINFCPTHGAQRLILSFLVEGYERDVAVFVNSVKGIAAQENDLLFFGAILIDHHRIRADRASSHVVGQGESLENLFRNTSAESVCHSSASTFISVYFNLFSDHGKTSLKNNVVEQFLNPTSILERVKVVAAMLNKIVGDDAPVKGIVFMVSPPRRTEAGQYCPHNVS